MRSKYLRIGLPVGLGAVIVGVLLGVFLPGGGDKAPAPPGAEVGSTDETAGEAATAEDAASPDGGTESAARSAGTEAGETAAADQPATQRDAADRSGGEGSAGDAAETAERETGAVAVDRATREADGAPSEAAASAEQAGTTQDDADAAERSVASADASSRGDATAALERADSPTDASGGERPTAGDAPPRLKPSFDVVHIDPKGGTVMAGRAEPGAEVIIRDGEQEIGRATANRRGEWVFTDDRPMPAGDRQLSLEDAAPGGLESEQVVVVSVPKPSPRQEQEREPAQGQAQDQGKQQEKQQALAVLQPREGGPSVVLQLPEEPAAAEDGAPQTAVDSLDYTSEGEITVSGRSEPGARLNVYVDNAPVTTAQADEEGRWQAALGDEVSEGQHQLRIDSVDQSGKVVARAETEIARAPKTMLELAGETLVIVQPGNSLWRIARRTYGGGVHYTEIYQANQNQIRDPDLIYPGQIFTVPPLG